MFMQEVVLSMRREEAAARSLLECFFRDNVDPAAQCRPGDDPPDLVCEAAGRRYAVEVTFATEQETLDGQTTARIERDIPLLQLGKRLGVATERIRSRKYTLFLEGLPSGARPRQWMRKLKKAVLAFVESAEEGTLELEGAWITAYGPGDGWQVAVVPRDKATTPGGQATDAPSEGLEGVNGILAATAN